MLNIKHFGGGLGWHPEILAGNANSVPDFPSRRSSCNNAIAIAIIKSHAWRDEAWISGERGEKRVRAIWYDRAMHACSQSDPLRSVRSVPLTSCILYKMPPVSTHHVLFSDTSLNTLKASLYASNKAFTRVRSATSASSSNSSSANRSGLYRLVTSRCCIASLEKLTWGISHLATCKIARTCQQVHDRFGNEVLNRLAGDAEVARDQGLDQSRLHLLLRRKL